MYAWLALAVIVLVGGGVFLALRGQKTQGPGGGLMEDRGWGDGQPAGPDLDRDGRGNDVHWSRDDLPLTLELSSGLSPAWQGQVAAAAEALNEIVGRRVFTTPIQAPADEETAVEVVGERPPRRHVYVMSDEGADPAHGVTDFYSWPDGRLYAASVTFPAGLARQDPLKAFKVAMHELLHVLGVAHTTDRASIMYPKVRSGPQHVLPATRLLIQSLYGTGKVTHD